MHLKLSDHSYWSVSTNYTPEKCPQCAQDRLSIMDEIKLILKLFTVFYVMRDNRNLKVSTQRPFLLSMFTFKPCLVPLLNNSFLHLDILSIFHLHKPRIYVSEALFSLQIQNNLETQNVIILCTVFKNDNINI
jgi:hypothetical protein